MNIQEAMKKAQNFQSEMAKMQDGLAKVEVEGIAGGGMVVFKSTCKGDPVSLKIDPSLLNPDDAEMLCDLVIAAIKNAKANADMRSKEEMDKLTSSLGIPSSMLEKMGIK